MRLKIFYKCVLGLLLLLPGLIYGQGATIVTKDLCWSYNSIDSTITGYYLYSSRTDTAKLINYLSPLGKTVDVSAGGTITLGKCCCESTSNTIPPPAEATFAQRLCLYDKGAYTSVNRYVYISSSGGQPIVFEYVDANGDPVEIAPTAELTYGYCDCCNANMN